MPIKSAVAILTWNRLPALKVCLESFRNHLPIDIPLAVFEDAGERDDTRGYLRARSRGRMTTARLDPNALYTTDQMRQSDEAFQVEAFYDLRSGETIHVSDQGVRTVPINQTLFCLGTRNLGVAGNSNRALKWMLESDADHFLLCNDDVRATGDFAAAYRQAHEDLGVGMFCFCDLPGEKYEPTFVQVGRYRVKLLPRMTGIVLSLTRAVVEKIGFFDARMGRFSEEHCEYTNRARLAGFLDLEGQRQLCMDVEVPLESQTVESSMPAEVLPILQKEASKTLRKLTARYLFEGIYRPFHLNAVQFAGAVPGAGIKTEYLRAGYAFETQPSMTT